MYLSAAVLINATYTVPCYSLIDLRHIACSFSKSRGDLQQFIGPICSTFWVYLLAADNSSLRWIKTCTISGPNASFKNALDLKTSVHFSSVLGTLRMP